MNPNDYQKQAHRTELHSEAPRCRFSVPIATHGGIEYPAVRVNHSVVGMAGEVGELASILERWVYYGTIPMEEVRESFKDELGDVLWYVAEACNALGLTMTEVMEANIRKLKVRFPEKYEQARTEARNREAEAEAVSSADGDKIVGMQSLMMCLHCRGSGRVSCEWSTDQTTCPRCEGRGILSPVVSQPPPPSCGCNHHWVLNVGITGARRLCTRCGLAESYT